ncbi:phosphogluconate dehydrogenase (NAD(+)-dependent, decarboxylating) [Sulfobacillus thermosulfidooxidans]|uniref:phosphogluconate dehydrogenase (NAD(+)-dependent, decarboxylating) n=1 Tax=Sulfobacillus thermosulfidooxidans TaxID=28034 RepID=UPI00096BC73C|nr:decarboxylating 6-phosphogluconate dehydrogenase [Sulfobacillus thermosulfidooxidans]OLZ09912.1 6-phosphogluconate dehydrogenase (decarboxylating) [Sulfobacillus thermosulfidooxidans]OLZ15782.1 6-phosphogluconate dehydrogenase (decarboxylating) [Sulfobacillus thermosulfidooxidans]OLZ18370.1 6-phosphogluconate dehydrogenase (decarboxylating) [Sulfobacillus thermosulfidooxidans]
MKIGMIGLGRMGGNMVKRLVLGGHEVVAYDRNPEVVKELQEENDIQGASSIPELVNLLEPQRVVWMMVPAGDPTEQTLETLLSLLSPGDIIIDGGNSNFRDSMRRAKLCRAQQIEFIDAGTSGGIWGLANGYCLMVGGEDDAVHYCEPVFKTLAPEDGYLHTGPVGSGHFVKMVHNGIEYGLLQAYGEGFEILKESQFPLDLPAIAALWNHGSVVRSWLLELLEQAYAQNPDLKNIRGYIEDSGEGRWTVEEAINENVPAPVITASLYARFASRQEESYGAKVIAALRNAFGGHPVKTE